MCPGWHQCPRTSTTLGTCGAAAGRPPFMRVKLSVPVSDHAPLSPEVGVKSIPNTGERTPAPRLTLHTDPAHEPLCTETPRELQTPVEVIKQPPNCSARPG